jgi:hypothetical protein
VKQNSLFVLKTLFPQKQSDKNFQNTTSTIELQLLTLSLPKATLKGEKDGAAIIKPGRLMAGNT